MKLTLIACVDLAQDPHWIDAVYLGGYKSVGPDCSELSITGIAIMWVNLRQFSV